MIHKSRDMGASWILVMICLWYWLFFKDKVFLLMSRKEVLVDRNKPQDKKSMFGKIDHAFKRLPVWMRPVNYTRTLLYFSNDDLGSEITGESTTGDSGRADRATAVIPDEFASIREADSIDAATARVTGCRIFNSTPKGSSNAFARKCQSGDIEKIVMLWHRNPDFRRGAYRWNNDGKLLFLDPKFHYKPDYPYVKDGKLRSPWFDTEEKRYGHPTLFAQEVEGDFFSSDFEFFDPKMLTEYQRDICRESLVVGHLGYGLDGEPTSFNAGNGGNMRIWVPFPSEGRPDKTMSYAVACDIAHGTGASPSVATVGCIDTKEVVAEFVDAHMDPRSFATFVVSLCRWFAGKDGEGAFLVWEGNGPGAAFGKKVWELGYRRFYYRKGGLRPTLDALGAHDRPSTIGGWYSNEDTRIDLLNQYAEAIKSRRLLNRSRESIEECRNFVYTDGGKIIHSKSKDAIDPSASRDSHSDRVISAGLLWKVMKELAGGEQAKNKEIPVHSAGYRRMQRRKQREREDLMVNSEYDLMEEFAA